MTIQSYRDLEVWQKAMELETHIQIAERLNYIDKSQVDCLMSKTAAIGRMLNGLRRSLEQKRNEVQNG